MSTLKKKVAEMIPGHLVVMDIVENIPQSKVTIIIDGPQPIDLQTTVSITKTVRNSGLLDEMYQDGFQLEVTSPGLDAPLTHPIQFKKNMGKVIKVRRIGELESSIVKIHDVKDKSFVGLSMDGVKSHLQFDNIESAFVEIKF
jgi:ribosome maturation factor RimP